MRLARARFSAWVRGLAGTATLLGGTWVHSGELTRLPEGAGLSGGEIRYRAAQVDSAPVIEETVLGALAGYSNCSKDPASGVRLFYDWIDLDGDSDPEVIAYLVGAETCGSGGCTALILAPERGGYRLDSRLTLVRAPILVSTSKSQGWRDLILHVSGGGAKAGYRVLHRGAGGYPGNPSLAPVLDPGTRISGDAVIADTIGPSTPAPVLSAAGCTAEGLAMGPPSVTDPLDFDALGGLRFGMAAGEALRLLGEPASRGEPLDSEMDGARHTPWHYPARGLTLDLVSDPQGGEERLGGIECVAPCDLETARGVRIGSAYDTVAAAYATERDSESSRPPESLVAGSPYGGVHFGFAAGKVARIFLGVRVD